jgi:transcriptional regulator with XRE-family HTH domain
MSEHAPGTPDDKVAPIFGAMATALRNTRTAWRCHLGRRLHQARQAHQGLDEAGKPVTSRRQLGEKLQLSEKAIWEIENGLAPLDTAELALFAEALNVHPGSFFDTKDFAPWSSPETGRLPYASVARALSQLSETERDIVIQLIMFLTGRCQHAARRPELPLAFAAPDQSMPWA